LETDVENGFIYTYLCTKIDRLTTAATRTGNYLKVQSEYYSNKNIEWIGIDKSDML